MWKQQQIVADNTTAGNASAATTDANYSATDIMESETTPATY